MVEVTLHMDKIITKIENVGNKMAVSEHRHKELPYITRNIDIMRVYYPKGLESRRVSALRKAGFELLKVIEKGKEKHQKNIEIWVRTP